MAIIRRALINANRILNSSSSLNRNSIIAAASKIQTEPFLRCPSVSRIYCSSSAQSLSYDLSNEENKRRLCNSLLYRSKQRGFLELDLILGSWVEENIHSMDENGIKALVHVLDLETPDLWMWLSGQEKPPEPVGQNHVFCAVHERVMKNLNSHTVPETRATPGKPWVRGWDDFKKGRDGPITGNQ